MNINNYFKGIVVAGVGFTAYMSKKTYDLLHEYTHRDLWITNKEWEKRQKRKAKMEAKKAKEES